MAKDRFHDVVRTALEKEGWKIKANPYEINLDDVDFEIDLAAEQLLAAEREGRKIAVEIKSFISPSNVSEFHTALGQFLIPFLCEAAIYLPPASAVPPWQGGTTGGS